MIVVFATVLWLGLWISAPPNQQSAIKLNYPRIELIDSLRAQFLENLGDRGDAGALVAGLAIGERSLLSESVSTEMRTLSLTHLVAVSGANLAIVIAAVWFLLAALGLGRNTRFALGLLAMAGYVLIVGPESSVLRAASMATFITISLWLGRGASPLHALALSVTLILIVDPGMAVDFGFSLSALATAGLLVSAEPIFKKLSPHMPDPLALGVAASFSAQLFTTPILLMLQPGLPLYSVLANVIVEPVVAPVTILGILAAVVSLALPGVSALLGYLATFGTKWIVLVAGELSGWPLARIHFVTGPLGVAIASGVIVATAAYFAAGEPAYKRMAGFAIAGLVFIGATVSALEGFRHTQAFSGWEVVACDVDQGDALLIKSGNQVALIDLGPEPKLLQDCLADSGVTRVDQLFVSHYDADHVAGIAGLSGTPVTNAFVPGFQDDRPLVSVVERYLKRSNVVIGQTGLTGTLGACTWLVLSPSRYAKEASDSNDASLVVRFDCPDFSVLTLGDLGEPGQVRLMRNPAGIQFDRPLILKVAHHGSADQSRELHSMLRPEIALISVGLNRFGHPTDRVLRILTSTSRSVYRTDLDGAVSISQVGGELKVKLAGKLAR